MIKINDLIRSRGVTDHRTPASNQIMDFNHGAGHFFLSSKYNFAFDKKKKNEFKIR